jgi:hypothetical protein
MKRRVMKAMIALLLGAFAGSSALAQMPGPGGGPGGPGGPGGSPRGPNPAVPAIIDLVGTMIRGAATNPPPAPYPVQTAPVYPDSDIMSVQSALREAGYYNGPIDGAISRRCRAAIRAYQRDYNLPVTGRIDPPLLRSLDL